MSAEIERVRVRGDQLMLFPIKSGNVCHNIGLNWPSAIWLYKQEFLSFDPRTEESLDDAQLAELNFLGSLVVAGCDRGMLERLLRHLKKPYQYRLNRIYYDWSSQRWSVLPQVEEIDEEDEISQDWIDEVIGRLETDMRDAFGDGEDK